MEAIKQFLQTAGTFFTEYVITPIRNMNWRDVIDILLLSFVLYVLYAFLRNRRAGRLLLGLTVVIIASVLVTLLRLPALSYIIRLFAAAAFFCLIVIFQPEVRDALEHLGNASFLHPFANRVRAKKMDAIKHVVDETVDAVFTMSASHTGALIVFEGLTGLGDYTLNAKPLDAGVTSLLLQNIFYNKAPLHDGALVIRNLRMIAAGCVLPSANGTEIFNTMGTRHRAAVGLTEVSDALVLVVSEETGIVSVAQYGKLLRRVDEKALTDILMTYLAGNTYLRAKRSNLRNEYLEMFQSIMDKKMKDAQSFKKEGDDGSQLKMNFDGSTDEGRSEIETEAALETSPNPRGEKK